MKEYNFLLRGRISPVLHLILNYLEKISFLNMFYFFFHIVLYLTVYIQLLTKDVTTSVWKSNTSLLTRRPVVLIHGYDILSRFTLKSTPLKRFTSAFSLTNSTHCFDSLCLIVSTLSTSTYCFLLFVGYL